ncbi:hypothetical protein O6P43_020221 [Quillaja saponaria]|uniref:Uncharacterized protein n=1 Tax=Quillaja saponaria TaxID=32244 RepID=A0AAD7LKL4_QUISA|nr:hypothetical protein O6P43_020221 [Quillaja saponaria]
MRNPLLILFLNGLNLRIGKGTNGAPITPSKSWISASRLLMIAFTLVRDGGEDLDSVLLYFIHDFKDLPCSGCSGVLFG